MAKKITNFEIDTSNIPQIGGTRNFTVYGEDGAGFYLVVKNEDPKWYNFTTNTFQSAETNLKAEASIAGYTGTIFFPQVSDADQYEIYLITDISLDSEHERFVPAFDESGAIDINRSFGSNSNFLSRRIYQTLDSVLTITPSELSSDAGFNSMTVTSDTITTSIDGSAPAIDFKIVATAANGSAFKIDRQPTPSDFYFSVDRTLTTFFRTGLAGSGTNSRFGFNCTNIALLEEGMSVTGTNVTANTIISSKEDIVTSQAGTDQENTIVLKSKKGLRRTGATSISYDSTTKVRTVTTAGEVIFDKPQVDALQLGTVTFSGYGIDQINRLTGWDISITDLKVEILPANRISTTTTSAVSNSTSVPITNAFGIMDDVSTVSSVNIIGDSPTVTAIGSYNVSSANTATLTLSSAQTLESGETLNFDGAAGRITITGKIRTNKASSAATINIDISRFITATVETA
tara:strand:+ start:1770 stop:3149 length:1380 start_codon:yes stop_codon:yes gene_type:complete